MKGARLRVFAHDQTFSIHPARSPRARGGGLSHSTEVPQGPSPTARTPALASDRLPPNRAELGRVDAPSQGARPSRKVRANENTRNRGREAGNRRQIARSFHPDLSNLHTGLTLHQSKPSPKQGFAKRTAIRASSGFRCQIRPQPDVNLRFQAVRTRRTGHGDPSRTAFGRRKWAWRGWMPRASSSVPVPTIP